MDLSQTVAPKSDQMNADDLIAGPRTITVTRVTANPDSPEQPVRIFFDGDNGKPYLPCKSMRRVLIAGWGADASTFTGRSMTLYRDPSVKFGGMAVGGIRISHMSHMDRDLSIALTETKAKRAIYKVATLKTPNATPPAAPEIDAEAAYTAARAAAAQGSEAFTAWWNSAEGKPMRATVKPIMDELKRMAADADAPPHATADDDEIPL